MGSPQYDNEILRYNVFVRSINGEYDLEIFEAERGRIVKIERVDKESVKELDYFLGDSTLSEEIQELEFQRDNFLITTDEEFEERVKRSRKKFAVTKKTEIEKESKLWGNMKESGKVASGRKRDSI